MVNKHLLLFVELVLELVSPFFLCVACNDTATRSLTFLSSFLPFSEKKLSELLTLMLLGVLKLESLELSYSLLDYEITLVAYFLL
jgi:hypothetical protein